LYEDNYFGCAILESRNLTLLKANSRYLDIMGLSRESCIGLMMKDSISGFEGSRYEEYFRKIRLTGESVYLKEYEGTMGNMVGKYWDIQLIPLKYDGEVKAIVCMLSDVSNTVLAKKQLEEKTAAVKKLRCQLRAIFDNIHDGIDFYDKDGNLINTSFRVTGIRSLLNITCRNKRELYEKCPPFDSDGNIIPYNKVPSERVINGEKFKNMQITCKLPDKTIHLKVNGSPVYDEKGNFQMGILVYDDITNEVENVKMQKKQQEALLASEIEKNEILEESLKYKDEFIYLITHEFKTPLTVIYSSLQTLEALYKDQIPEKARKYLNTIKQNTNRQLRLVKNLLDISRLTSGNIKLNVGTFDIVYLVHSIVESVQDFVKKKGISLTFSTTFNYKKILIDEEKVERIILNLLSNAIKFTPKGKSIYVKLDTIKYRNKNMISISVQDEGIGIPKDKQKYIFTRFGQVNNSLSRPAEGTGIGLHLVKLLVLELGGHIILESEEGRGSTFIVLLPVNNKKLKKSEESTEQISMKLDSDSRLIDSISVEFSDIYL